MDSRAALRLGSSALTFNVTIYLKYAPTSMTVVPRLSPNEPNPENAVRDLVSFLPVLAYDGANMTQLDAGGILGVAMADTSATLLARKWQSALLVNVDNDTLRRILDSPAAWPPWSASGAGVRWATTSSRPSSTKREGQ
jgi:hypothetical protein